MNLIKSILEQVKEPSNSKTKQQQFGLLVILILLISFSLSIYKQGYQFNLKQEVLISLILVLSIVTYRYSKLFYPLLVVWLFIGNVLGEITSFIILAIVYYILISPITYFLRIKNKSKTNLGWVQKKNKIDYKKLY